jgi:hypothetical protein
MGISKEKATEVLSESINNLRHVLGFAGPSFRRGESLLESTEKVALTLTDDFQLKQGLMSASEYRLYRTLLDNIPADWSILTRVRASDVVAPAALPGTKDWSTQAAKLKSKTFDFVLWNWRTNDVTLVVQLTEQNAKRNRQDESLKQICDRCGLQILFVDDVDALNLHTISQAS